LSSHQQAGESCQRNCFEGVTFENTLSALSAMFYPQQNIHNNGHKIVQFGLIDLVKPTICQKEH